MNEVALLPPLARGCHAIATSHVAGMVGLLVGSRHALLIDAGTGHREGLAIAEAAAEIRRPDLVVFSHGHWDHVRGAVAMADVDSIVHRDALPATLDQLRLEGPVDGPLPSPSIVSRGPLQLDLGGLTVELQETPGHAPGSWCVWVPSTGVLYAGDTVVTAIPPVFADGDSMTLERTLRALAAMPIQVLVPGHGRVVAGAADVRACLEARADYLAAIRRVAIERLAADGADGVVAALPLASVPPDALERGRVPEADLRARHERAVRGVVAELGLRPT